MIIALAIAAAVHAAPKLTPTPTHPVVLMTPQGFIAFGYPPCGTEEAKKATACIAYQIVPCPAPDDRTSNTWALPILPLGCSAPTKTIKAP